VEDNRWALRSIPGQEDVADVARWVIGINSWAANEIANWECSPTWATAPTTNTREAWAARGGAALIDYACPASQVPSALCARWVDTDGTPRSCPEALVAYLKGQGVRRVVVGNVPQGNCPSLVLHGDLTVVMIDTSYSQPGSDLAFEGDHRGAAVAEVIIDGPTCTVRGVTEDQEFVEYKSGGPRGDPLVGRVLGKRFVKARCLGRKDADEVSYLLAQFLGYKVEYSHLTEDEVVQALKSKAEAEPRHQRTLLTSCGDLFGASMTGDSSATAIRHLLAALGVQPGGELSGEMLQSLAEDAVACDLIGYHFPGCGLEELWGWAAEATEPVNEESLLERCRQKAPEVPFPVAGRLTITVASGRNLRAADRAMMGFGAPVSSDPYVVLKCVSGDGKSQTHTTKVVNKNLNPDWDETFVFDVKGQRLPKLSLETFDKDMMKSDFLGRANIPFPYTAKQMRIRVPLTGELATGHIELVCQFESDDDGFVWPARDLGTASESPFEDDPPVPATAVAEVDSASPDLSTQNRRATAYFSPAGSDADEGFFVDASASKTLQGGMNPSDDSDSDEISVASM